MTAEPTTARVVVSFPDGLSTWSHSQLIVDRFATHLRRVHEDTASDDEWEKFLGIDYYDGSLTLTLRVEELDLEGTTRVDDETAVEFVEREGNVRGG